MELTVIIPAFNAEKTLPDTLASLRAQTLSAAWEVIAVDDGSTDGTGGILAAAAADFPAPFQVITQENAGVGAARNRGLIAAEGDYVTWLDADDLLLPDALNTALTEALSRDADILMFDSEYLYPDGRVEPYPASPEPAGDLTARDYLYAEPAPWNKLIRRKIFVDEGLRFPEGIWYEDLALIPALGAFAEKIWYCKKVLHRYNRAGESITRGAWSAKRLDILKALDCLIRLVPTQREDAEVLAFRHLYGTFAWQAWQAGDLDAIRAINAFVADKLPHWEKDPLIQLEPWKRRFTATLFYREEFGLLRLWKGFGS
ncbi:MAG: glycosyltransferase [Clostridia bacterium]|nr:glycosyltransferase [Clostridia bacterium]